MRGEFIVIVREETDQQPAVYRDVLLPVRHEGPQQLLDVLVPEVVVYLAPVSSHVLVV